MKIFSVFGVSDSGKTTTIELLIRELIRRGYSVGSLKDIHFEGFAIDTPGTNTHRHKQAGANPVTARGLNETDILFTGKLSIAEILRFYRDKDFVILEGVREPGIPAILTAGADADEVDKLDEQITPFVFALSGKAAADINKDINEHNKYCSLPAIDATTDIDALADLVERKVYDYLPMQPKECCGLCGFDCETLGQRIIAGESSRGDCLLQKQVSLTVNGEEIEMVSFVQTILKNAVLAVAKELRGYEKGQIQVTFYDE